MAWSVTDWTTKPVWQYATLVNEFIGAVRERGLAYVTNYSTPSYVVAETLIQEAVFWADGYPQKALQERIERLVLVYAKSHAGGEALAAGHYDGAPSVPLYASLAEAFAAAGLDYSDWRRYTTHPDDGGEVAYGQMQAGDIIGPWIFEDLQKILNVLVWTRRTTWYTNVDRVEYDGYGTGGNWAAAKTAVEADWAEGYTGNVMAYSRGIATPGLTNYYGWLKRGQSKRQEAGVWNDVVRHADWYVRATKYPATGGDVSVFDANGDLGPDDREDLYFLWSQDEPATDAETIVSDTTLGSASVKPTWCAEPGENQYVTRGWVLASDPFFVVVRWNVSGGFTYQ